MRKTSVTVIAICATLLWLGEAHAELQTHATNPAVPEGTVYDTTTNLLWEMKSPAGTGGVHDVNNGYTWSVGTYSRIPPDGTVFKSFLASLNGGNYYDHSVALVVNSKPTSCFLDHCDWRLPSIMELQTIVNTSYSPTIDPIFGPTASGFYWSATTFAGDTVYAWGVFFNFQGLVAKDNKDARPFVRAVRSGL